MRVALIALLGFLPCLSYAAAAAKAPAWLSELAQVDVRAFAQDAKAVVLLDESQRKVGADGKIISVSRHAVRVLKLDGRDAAQALIPYNADFQKITAFEAWLLPPQGKVRNYTRKQVVDVALNLDQVYTNARSLALSVSAEVEAGAVFGYTWTVEEKSMFSQDRWGFQGDLPVVLSRVTYELPPGWKIDPIPMARVEIVPSVQGNRYSWELRDLPAIAAEAWGPPPADLAAGVALNVVPAAGARVPWRNFGTWQDVSRYIAELHDSRATPDPAITAKTQQLIASATTLWEKIRAIGRYAQSVNYASIQLGTGRGGGYTPNPASQVFQRNYGDCKDKTVLMRAMLQAAGVRSYSTIAFAQERRAVFESWPSPQQFDHCIVAIAVDETVDGPAIVAHPELGRLLVFDPTSTLTPAGELTTVQQGSRVLVGAGTARDLLELPFPAPQRNQLVRRMEAKLESNGTLTAVVTETSRGVPAIVQRSEFREASPAQYSRVIETWISRGARAARIARVEPKDLMGESGAFELRVEFSAQNYAQSMGGQLLVFKPAVIPRQVHSVLNETRRMTPVRLPPSAYDETIIITLPADFAVDELPSAVTITRSFGSYSLVGEVRDGVLHFRRSYVLQAAEIPPDRCEEVRSFFEAINRAEQTPVVLRRQ